MLFPKKKSIIDKDELINYCQQGAVIIDVRTIEEFEAGHNEGATHIELSTLPNKISEIQSLGSKFIMVCLSGGRSQRAVDFLKENNIDAINGGGWEEFAEILGNNN